MLICMIPVSPSVFSYLPSSSFLPQFPKNNNNNRMPSVNIIEVWLPGRLLFYPKDFVFSQTSGPLLSPSACQDEAGTLGPMVVPILLWYRAWHWGDAARLQWSSTAWPVLLWEQRRQRRDCGEKSVAAPCSISSVPGGSRVCDQVAPAVKRLQRNQPQGPKPINRARDLFIASLCLPLSPFSSLHLLVRYQWPQTWTFPISGWHRDASTLSISSLVL